MPTHALSAVPLGTVEGAVLGALEIEHTREGIAPRRLPAWTRAQYGSPVMEWVANQTTGVHLDFMTFADVIEFDVMITRNLAEGTDSSERLSTFVAVVGGVETDRVALDEGHRLWVREDKSHTEEPGAASRFSLQLGSSGGSERRVVIWLPHNSWVEIRGVRASAPLLPASPRGEITWLHHGSSISHGSNADGPRGTWPAIAAAGLGVDVVNLGFNGQALLDPFTARSIRDTAADVITLKIGINIVNGDVMRARALIPAIHGFLDTIREGHPLTPIVFISPIACPIHEDIPGPTVVIEEGTTELCFGTPRALDENDGVLTLRRIRALTEKAIGDRSVTDSRLFYMDGRDLFTEHDAHLLYDNLHPDGDGYRLMGERFAAHARSAGSSLATAFAIAEEGRVLRMTAGRSSEGDGED
ncbi:GDSL-type esterase/lipase family protein [Microbacterium sp. NPDC058342]|uniref:GDSL-type esterase/lipase family protein n=1 Tax=Microbacterium sp. NPDC058342 TaxID=3346454 RepID=UPI0036698B5E